MVGSNFPPNARYGCKQKQSKQDFPSPERSCIAMALVNYLPLGGDITQQPERKTQKAIYYKTLEHYLNFFNKGIKCNFTIFPHVNSDNVCLIISEL